MLLRLQYHFELQMSVSHEAAQNGHTSPMEASLDNLIKLEK